MKKLFTILTGLLITVSVFGQTGEIIAIPLGQPRPTNLTVSNHYKGTDVKYKLKSIKIIVKNNTVSSIEQPVNEGLERTPNKIPPEIREVTWTVNKGNIPNGETDLGKIHFSAAENFSVVCQLLNEKGDVIYQTNSIWTDYNMHDPGIIEADATSISSFQLRWTPIMPKPQEPISYIMLSLGAGSSMPSSDTKDNGHFSNSPVITADTYIPLVSLGKNSHFGINLGGSYYLGGSVDNPNDPLPGAINIVGQSSPPTVAYSVDSPGSKGFSLGAGPQINFHLGDHFIISPILSLEYLSITRKEIRAVQTSVVDGETFAFNLITLPETKTSGFAFSPKIRLNYLFTRHIGIWVEGSYTVGPKTKTSSNVLIPEGEADGEGSYTVSQLQNATYVQKETVSTGYRALGVNVGLVYEFRTVYPLPKRHQK